MKKIKINFKDLSKMTNKEILKLFKSVTKKGFDYLDQNIDDNHCQWNDLYYNNYGGQIVDIISGWKKRAELVNKPKENDVNDTKLILQGIADLKIYIDEKIEVTNQNIKITNQKIDNLKNYVDEKIEITNQKIEITNQKIEEAKQEIKVANQKIDKLEIKVDRIEAKFDLGFNNLKNHFGIDFLKDQKNQK